MPGEAQLWISHLTRERQRHKHQERMNVQRSAGENHIHFSPREEALSTHEKMPQSNCLGGPASVQDGRSDKRGSLRPDMNKPRIIIAELRCGESLANRNPRGQVPPGGPDTQLSPPAEQRSWDTAHMLTSSRAPRGGRDIWGALGAQTQGSVCWGQACTGTESWGLCRGTGRAALWLGAPSSQGGGPGRPGETTSALNLSGARQEFPMAGDRAPPAVGTAKMRLGCWFWGVGGAACKPTPGTTVWGPGGGWRDPRGPASSPWGSRGMSAVQVVGPATARVPLDNGLRHTCSLLALGAAG